MRLILFIVFIFALSESFAFDITKYVAIKQKEEIVKGNSFFFELGLGFGGMNDSKDGIEQTGGFAYKGDFYYITEEHRYMKLSLFSTKGFGGNVNFNPHTFQVSYMTGFFSGSKNGVFSLNFGLSYVTGAKWGELIESSGWLYSKDTYEKVGFNTIGFPLEVLLGLKFGEVSNINLIFHTNLNPELTTVSLMLLFRAGNPFKNN